MNRTDRKPEVIALLALVVAVVLGLAGASEAEGAEARAGEAKGVRPAWTPGHTIDASSWDYDGPVSVIYTQENAPAPPRLEDLPAKESVSQHGITWTFEKPVPAGRFITGDWYVVGPVMVVKITPEPLFGEAVKDHPDWEIINRQAVKEEEHYRGNWARNGSVINQRVDTHRGGFDSRLAHRHYDPEQFARLPIQMKPSHSLISTTSAADPLRAYSGHGQPLLTAAVLTCMDAPQPADAFRPSYCDRENRTYLARNLRRHLLYALPRPAAAPTNLSEWARLFQRPWLDTVSWGFANPELNSPRYGQRMTNSVSTASLLLHLDYPAIEKEQLLVHYVQYGIDLWGIVRAGSEGWRGHGGFGGGRKWTLVFSGIMLGDAEMRSPNNTYPKLLFGEDTQTASGKSWTGHNVVFTSHPAWTDAKTASPELEHPGKWKEMREKNPHRRGYQSEGYRRCCTSVEWPGEALAARLMRAEKYWNHDPFFTYVDRWMEGEDIHATARVVLEAAKAAGKDWGEWTLRQDRTSVLMQEMWDKYRENLPPALGAETPPATGPLFVWADLARGESRELTLTNGRRVRVRLLETGATRDRGPRHPVRSSTATVEVDGRRVTLGCGNYNLPTAVAGVQIDCTITSNYYEDTRHDFWGLEKGKDARLRVWPEDSPLMPHGRMVYPVKQRWFASNTQMSNEPTWVDGGEERSPGDVYYHYGLDIGVAELITEAVAAVDGTVVALKGQWMPEHKDVEPPHGITPACVFILDDWGWYHRYEHLQRFNPALALGTRVTQGQLLGVGSKVGGTSWSHVHYDIRHRHPNGGHWVLQDGYPFLLECYERQYGAKVIAVARPHQVAITGDPVTLDASRSWSRGRIVGYEWTLSDGRRARGPRVTRTYSKPGMYSEIVKVSEAGGTFDHDFAVVLVFDRKDTAKAPHTIHASFSPTVGIKPGDPITFTVRTFGTSDGEEIWDFDDGTPPVTVRSLDGLVRELRQDPKGYAATVHRFQRAGHYLVRVERTSAAGVCSRTHLDVVVGVD